MQKSKLRLVIPGGSGQVGRMLARHFHAAGHMVTVLSRDPKPSPWRVVYWDGRKPALWISELEGCDVCINLAGRSVNCRYNSANRRAIYDSRIDSTRLLNEVVASLANPPRVWLNASTATIYRHALDRPQDEATGELGGNEPGAPKTWNFSIAVAKDWERVFFETATPKTRKVAMRSAIAFSPDRGSAFEVLLNLVRFGLGGAEGSGAQYVSWIHEVDFIRAVEFLIEREDLEGTINLASPHPLPNRQFMRAFREAWGARLGLPAAAWMIEAGTFCFSGMVRGGGGFGPAMAGFSGLSARQPSLVEGRRTGPKTRPEDEDGRFDPPTLPQRTAKGWGTPLRLLG